MRSSPFIELQFSAPTADLLVAMEAAGGAGVLSAFAYVLQGCFSGDIRYCHPCGLSYSALPVECCEATA
jgi:hypothetical protein